ncbi:MAG: hypothetical protein KF779_09505 [Hyphomonadaceae bacterium]|nr:hypothetical protein [Hyphomonadaceae bacterium]
MLMAGGNTERFEEISSGDDDYFGVSGRSESDFCSRDGAQSLKAKIEAYWADRGHKVQVMLHNVGFHPAIRAARFDVRSDMVNGMPRTVSEQSRVAPAQAYVEDFDNSDSDLVFE